MCTGFSSINLFSSNNRLPNTPHTLPLFHAAHYILSTFSHLPLNFISTGIHFASSLPSSICILSPLNFISTGIYLFLASHHLFAYPCPLSLSLLTRYTLSHVPLDALLTLSPFPLGMRVCTLPPSSGLVLMFIFVFLSTLSLASMFLLTFSRVYRVFSLA